MEKDEEIGMKHDDSTGCPLMLKSEDDDGRSRGFMKIWAYNFKTNKNRLVGIMYRAFRGDAGMMLNVCPFCGKEIDQGFKNK